MIALLYGNIYLIIVIYMTYSVMSSYHLYRNVGYLNTYAKKKNPLLIPALFFSVTIGLRPISSVFGDMVNYQEEYRIIQSNTYNYTFDTENFLFDNILPFFATNGIPVEYYFLLIATIYFGCMAWACTKIFPRDALLAFVVYLGAFSTFSFGTNGIKAGAAASVFLLALAYRKKKGWAIFFLWLSLGIHHAMMAPIVAYVMAYFYRKPNAYLWAWIVCLLLAAAHITFFMSWFSGYTDDHGANYLAVDRLDKNVSGFRPDFILYSAVPIFLGYNLMRKRYVVSEFYNFLWCIYTMTNSVFLLCTYGSYINRIAYLSWLMYPIILLYPFVNTEWSNHPAVSKRYLKYAVYGHLGFTAFMSFVYYA